MEGYIIRKLLGIRLVVALFLMTLVGVPLLQVINSTSVAAAATYTWTNATTITGGAETFVQVTVDDANKQLSIPADEMILESTSSSKASCGQNGANVNRDGAVFNPSPTVKNGSSVADASFGRGNLIIVRPYVSATSATLVTFSDTSLETCVPHASSVSLQNVAGATWIDSQHIQYLDDTLTYQSVSGNTMTLKGKTPNNNFHPNQCAAEVLTIGDDTTGYMSAKTATLAVSTYQEGSGGQGACLRSTMQVSMTNQYIGNGIGTTGHWVANATDPNAAIVIDSVGADAAVYLKNGDTYLESSKNPISGQDMTLLHPSTCPGVVDNTMHVNPYTSATSATITAAANNGHGCSNATLIVGITAAYGNNGSASTTGTDPTTVNDGCSVSTNEAFRWLYCPLISSLQGVATSINGLIASQLIVPDSIFFNPTVQNIYNIFRNIGVALLVVFGLIMVVSQAADLELFAAHTVRKALPRIIIVAILISISWPLLRFTVDFFNDIGIWVGKIILSVSNYTYVGANGWSALGDKLILAMVAVGGITLLGAGGIISLLVSIVLLLFVGEFVLMIRWVIILLWILLTPIALAASTMDGTKKMYEFWKDTGETTMFMSPIIMGFLGSGTALAYIISSVKANDYFYNLLATVIFFAPYIALPFAFKLAGGLIGRVIEFAQGTHNQTIESKLQGYRQNAVAKNWNATKGGSRWNPNSGYTRWMGGNAVNFVGRHIGAGARGRFGFGITAAQRARGAAAMANNMNLTADAASKMDHNFAAQMNNEEAMVAVAFGNDANRLRRLRYFQDNTIEANGRTAGENRLASALAAGQTIQATQQMQAAAGDALIRSGKILDNRAEFQGMLDSISHGNGALRGSLKGAYQYTARQIGRADIGRDNDAASLEELDISSVIRQKPSSLANLFGPGRPAIPGGPAGPAPIVRAINESYTQAGRAGTDVRTAERHRAQAQHYADVLFAAQYNASLSSQQHGYLQGAIADINALDPNLMARAQQHYGDKFSRGQQPPSP
jgi:hypothetical protein